MKKMNTFLGVFTSFLFGLGSYLFYTSYLAWNNMFTVTVSNIACTIAFASAGMIICLAKGTDRKKCLVTGAVCAAVYEAVLWGVLTLVNKNGLFNVRAVNTAYCIVIAMFAVLMFIAFGLLIKNGYRAFNTVVVCIFAVCLAIGIAEPFVPFISDVFKGDASLHFDNYVFIDREYGDDERQVFDLYIPGNNEHPQSLILCIHGGGWIAGSKSDCEALVKSWAKKGYACAAISYHYVSADVHMNVLTDDITLALSEIKKLADENGCELEKCLLTGGSAGGHLSLLYAYSMADKAPVKPVAVVSYSGPADLRNDRYIFGNRLGDETFMSGLMSAVCGEAVNVDDLEATDEALWEYSPLKYAANAVPTVFAHGKCDSVVPFEDTQTLVNELERLGIKHDFVIYPNSDHDLAADPDCAAQTEELFERYVEEYLK